MTGERTPIVGVGAVIVHEDRVLIVKRAHEPRKGEWSIPGGRLELGETLEAAVRREVHEETGLEVVVGEVIEVFDRIDHTPDGAVAYHVVVVDYLCTMIGGRAEAGDDAEAIAWVDEAGIRAHGVHSHAATVLRRGLARVRARQSGSAAPGAFC